MNQFTENSEIPEKAQPKTERILFLDNLRSASILAVISLHSAIAVLGLYSEEVLQSKNIGWYEQLSLGWFIATSQIVSMGIMFFIAGYFTPASYDKKGKRQYLIDRLFRLGVPLIIFDLVIYPIVMYLSNSLVSQKSGNPGFSGSFLPFSNGIGAGPIWFIEHLLIFSLIYVLWRTIRKNPGKKQKDRTAPTGRQILLFCFLVLIATILVRVLFPINWPNFFNLKIAYIPLYFSLFITGMLAYQNSWLTAWTARSGRRWLVVGLVALLCFPIFLVIGAGERILGGARPVAAGYAIWEIMITVGLGFGLIIWSRQHWNSQNKFEKALSDNSYAAYFIHAPVIAMANYLTYKWDMSIILRFIWLSITSILLSYLISHFILRYIPGLNSALFGKKRSSSYN